MTDHTTALRRAREALSEIATREARTVIPWTHEAAADEFSRMLGLDRGEARRALAEIDAALEAAQPPAPEIPAFDPLKGGCPHCKWLDTNLGRVLDQKCGLHQKIEDMLADRQIDRQVAKATTKLMGDVIRILGGDDADDPRQLAQNRMDEINEAALAELEAALAQPAAASNALPLADNGWSVEQCASYLRMLGDTSGMLARMAQRKGKGDTSANIENQERSVFLPMIARLLEQVAQPADATDAGDGWQPWSTAPREPLVYILAASFDENAFEDEAIEIRVVSWDRSGWSFEHDDADEPFEPVAWMPIKPFHRRMLPAPPAQGGEDA